jgi:peptide/nickel transport system substrate-binding protein
MNWRYAGLIFLIIISVVLASCASEAISSKPPATTSQATVTTTAPVTKTTSDKPQYGGRLTMVLPTNIQHFTDVGFPFESVTLMLQNETVISGDWSRGPAGTNEFSFAKAMYGAWNNCNGVLAESWEIPEIGKIVFHIRKGIRYTVSPNSAASKLVGGRELNANDIARTFELLRTVPGSAPSFAGFKMSKNTAVDDWTMECVLPPELFDEVRITFMYCPTFAPELYDAGLNMDDWKNAVGTGPFMVNDFVSGSSATMVRNPNYWMTDPVGSGKGQQLPYVDSIKFLIIVDDSTRLSAFRTGKIDVSHSIPAEDAAILAQNKSIKSLKHFGDALHALAMRTDKQDLPFKDIRVRRAMMMATDFDTIGQTWGSGEYQKNTFPLHYTQEEAAAYLSLDDADCPDTVKELYVYNPEKAKALLTEAGYPDGFSTSIISRSNPNSIDYLSIIKEQWSKVNINLTIEPKEDVVFTTFDGDRKHQEMIDEGGGPNANMFIASLINGQTRGGNMSYVDDQKVKDAYAAWSPLTISDPVKAMGIHRELMKYVLDQAWVIPGVNPAVYHMWWPWLKNYHGELGMARTIRGFAKYVWIDREMKDSMGY